MLKKLSAFVAILLCGTFCAAQNSIDSDVLIRYVQAKYVCGIIAKQKNLPSTAGYAKCERCTLENLQDIPSTDEINALCNDYQKYFNNQPILHDAARSVSERKVAIESATTAQGEIEALFDLSFPQNPKVVEFRKDILKPIQVDVENCLIGKPATGTSPTYSPVSNYRNRRERRTSQGDTDSDVQKLKSLTINKQRTNPQGEYILSIAPTPPDYKPKFIKWRVSNRKRIELQGSDSSETCQILHNKGKAKVTVEVDGKKASVTIGSSGFGTFLFWVLLIVVLFLVWRNRKNVASFFRERTKTVRHEDEGQTSLSSPTPKKHEADAESDIIRQLKGVIVKQEKELADVLERVSMLEQKIRKLEARQSETHNSVHTYVSQASESAQRTSRPIGNGDSTFASRTRYAVSIIDKVFKGVTNNVDEDSVFQIDMTSDSTAKITILSSAYPRILANAAFVEGCDLQYINREHKVYVDEPGVAQRNNQGDWMVIKPIKVRIG